MTPEPSLNLDEVLDDLFTYHPPTDDQKAKYELINAAARGFAAIVLSTCPPCPDRTAAIRLIREARMTANASIATRTGGAMFLFTQEGGKP